MAAVSLRLRHSSLRRPDRDGVCFSEILEVLADYEPPAVIRFENRLKVAIFPVLQVFANYDGIIGKYLKFSGRRLMFTLTTNKHVRKQCRIYVLIGRRANYVTRPHGRRIFDRNICSNLIYFWMQLSFYKVTVINQL